MLMLYLSIYVLIVSDYKEVDRYRMQNPADMEGSKTPSLEHHTLEPHDMLSWGTLRQRERRVSLSVSSVYMMNLISVFQWMGGQRVLY
jgi:hypothetical protein